MLDVGLLELARDVSQAITGARLVFHGGSGRDDDLAFTFRFDAPAERGSSLLFTSVPFSSQPGCTLALDRRGSGAFDVTGTFQLDGHSAYAVCGAVAGADVNEPFQVGCGLATPYLQGDVGAWIPSATPFGPAKLGVQAASPEHWFPDLPVTYSLSALPQGRFEFLDAPVVDAETGTTRIVGALSGSNVDGGASGRLVLEKAPGSRAGLRAIHLTGAGLREQSCLQRAGTDGGVPCTAAALRVEFVSGVWWSLVGMWRIEPAVGPSTTARFFPFAAGAERFAAPLEMSVSGLDGGFTVSSGPLAGRYAVESNARYSGPGRAPFEVGLSLVRQGVGFAAARRSLLLEEAWPAELEVVNGQGDPLFMVFEQEGGDFAVVPTNDSAELGRGTWRGRVAPGADLLFDATLAPESPPDGGARLLRIRQLPDGGLYLRATRSDGGVVIEGEVIP